MKHGTYTAGLTPEQVIRDAWHDKADCGCADACDCDSRSFYWDLKGTDSRNADTLGLHNHNEETLEGFLAIIGLLYDAWNDEEPDEHEDGESLGNWAMSMRSDMLGCLEIEEV